MLAGGLLRGCLRRIHLCGPCGIPGTAASIPTAFDVSMARMEGQEGCFTLLAWPSVEK
jgi:hypothetical protein